MSARVPTASPNPLPRADRPVVGTDWASRGDTAPPVASSGGEGGHCGAGSRPPATGTPCPSSTSFSFLDDKSELEGSTLSVLSATSTASHLLPPQERLREKAFEYCQRLVEQSTRRESRRRISSPRGHPWPLLGGLQSPGTVFLMQTPGAGQGAKPVPSPQASVPASCSSALGWGWGVAVRPFLQLPEQGASRSLYCL